MTKIKIFTLSMMILLGGFVLSTPFDALAAETQTKTVAQNKTKEINVQNFMDSYGTKARKYSTKTELSQQSHDAAIAKIKKYEDVRDKYRDTCKKSYEEAIEARQKAAEASYQAALNKYAERNQRLKSSLSNLFGAAKDIFKGESKEAVLEKLRAAAGDGWDAIKSDVKGSLNQLDSEWQSVRAMWNKTGLNMKVDDLMEWVEDEAAKIFVSWLNPDGGYAFTSNARSVISFCRDANKPLDEKAERELLDLADEAEAANFDSALLGDLEGFGDDVYEHCYTGKNGEQQCVYYVVNVENNTIRSVKGVTAGCMPLPFKLYEARSCQFCKLFHIIIDTVQNASTKSFRSLGQPLATLVLIGLAIWIAFMVLQNVSAMTKQDAPKFLTDLFKNSFKVVIAYFMLKYSFIVYDYIIGPILKAGFELGYAFINVNTDMMSSCREQAKFTTTGGVMPSYIKPYLVCFIEAVEYELATSQAIGDSLMCISRNAAKGNLGAFAKVLPDFSMMITGGLIYIISFIMLMGFSFYLVDATVQLGIFGVLIPFLILCWPFEKTKSYFQTGVKIFMNSWFVYVFMGIIVNINLSLIGESLTGGSGGLSAVESAINGNNVQKLRDLLGIGYSGFLILVACCVMSIKLMQKVEEIASKFSGGLNLGIGAKVGGLAASGATGGTKALAGFAGNRLKGVANAKVWGKEGQEKSIADMWRSGKHAVGRGIANKVQGAGKGLGRMLGGLGGHR